MDPISGTSSTSSAQYTSSIESSHHAGGGMNAASLQKWLEAQVGEMWDKVSNATSGIDGRNKSQRDLAELQRRATAGEPIPAEEVRAVAARMPEGAERDNVLALVAGCGSPEQTAKLEADLEVANEKADKATKQENDWDAAHPHKAGDPIVLGGNNPYAAEAANARGEAHFAKLAVDYPANPSTVSGANVADGFKNAAGALDKQNTLAMTELQYMASTAQQAMSLVGNILKIQGDSAKETIGKIS